MNPIHELIVQILPVLIKLFQGTDGPVVLGDEAQGLHSGSGWLLREVMGEVRVMHRHVVVGHVVAVRVCKVEGGTSSANSKPQSSHLKISDILGFTLFFCLRARLGNAYSHAHVVGFEHVRLCPT